MTGWATRAMFRHHELAACFSGRLQMFDFVKKCSSAQGLKLRWTEALATEGWILGDAAGPSVAALMSCDRRAARALGAPALHLAALGLRLGFPQARLLCDY